MIYLLYFLIIPALVLAATPSSPIWWRSLRLIIAIVAYYVLTQNQLEYDLALMDEQFATTKELMSPFDIEGYHHLYTVNRHFSVFGVFDSMMFVSLFDVMWRRVYRKTLSEMPEDIRRDIVSRVVGAAVKYVFLLIFIVLLISIMLKVDRFMKPVIEVIASQFRY